MKIKKQLKIYLQIIKLPGCRTARLLEFLINNSPAIRQSGNPAVRQSGSQAVRQSGSPAIGQPGKLVIQYSNIILTISLLIMMSGCGSKRDPQIELIQDMMKSPAIKAQDYDEKKPGSLAMRLPPEGAVPKGHRPYTIKTPEEAEELLQNPLPASYDVLRTGQKMYYIYCGSCHGMTGIGDGPVAEKAMLKPPSLVNAKIKGWKDGGIYHLMTAGRGLMGSFASQIPNEQDRWALVHFIRRLQAHVDEDTPDVSATTENTEEDTEEDTTTEEESSTETTESI